MVVTAPPEAALGDVVCSALQMRPSGRGGHTSYRVVDSFFDTPSSPQPSCHSVAAKLSEWGLGDCTTLKTNLLYKYDCNTRCTSWVDFPVPLSEKDEVLMFDHVLCVIMLVCC